LLAIFVLEWYDIIYKNDRFCFGRYSMFDEIMNTDLHRRIEFVAEIDKLKNILRRTLLTDGSRNENDAEHSWHLAMMAMVFYDYSGPKDIRLDRVIKMLLVHDIVEIDAGDTFAYDTEGYKTKTAREKAAADRIFGMLPSGLSDELYGLWKEFEEEESPDARFAVALDRFQPLLHNYLTNGHTWRLGRVTEEQVLKRMEPVREGVPELWGLVLSVIDEGKSKGYIIKI